MQADIEISDNAITGTLKHVDNYTGFSSIDSEQNGNYLALHCKPDINGAAVTIQSNRSPVTLDPDGLAIIRITNKDLQSITVRASKVGYRDAVKVLSLSGLTCAES